VLPFYHYGLDDILPNKQPYVPRTKQKTTIVIGKPIYFDELVKELKEKQKSAVITFYFI
jgi:monolysocardiolipin acyltransferase